MRPRLAVLLALPLAAGCRASGDVAPPEAEPYTPTAAEEETSLGFFLVELDNRLRAWSNLRLGASSARERRTVRGLEREIAHVSSRRQEELLAALESPAASNRAVAAVALGFTGDPAVIGPLVAALSDPDPLVVDDALLGLGVLAHPDTPLPRLCRELAAATDPWRRNNAAFALAAIVASGGSDPCVLDAARGGLLDPMEGVRAQSAALLGILGDAGAVEALGDLVYDDAALVASAAAAALAEIGRVEPRAKGPAARALVDALDRVRPELREVLRAAASRLAGGDLGSDAAPWVEWAYRLP